MRLGMKDLFLFYVINNKHHPDGELTISHENWVFVWEIDGFVPENCNISIKVSDGAYLVKAHTCNVRCWGVTFKVPDMPVATSVLDNVTGKFVCNDGKTIELTNGNGEISIRQ